MMNYVYEILRNITFIFILLIEQFCVYVFFGVCDHDRPASLSFH